MLHACGLRAGAVSNALAFHFAHDGQVSTQVKQISSTVFSPPTFSVIQQVWMCAFCFGGLMALSIEKLLPSHTPHTPHTHTQKLWLDSRTNVYGNQVMGYNCIDRQWHNAMTMVKYNCSLSTTRAGEITKPCNPAGGCVLRNLNEIGPLRQNAFDINANSSCSVNPLL